MPVTLSDNRKLTDFDLSVLLDIVTHTLEHYLSGAPIEPLTLSDYPTRLTVPGACYVTLTVAGKLQGCIGTTMTQMPLVQEVQRKALGAACQDQRFTPLVAEQADELTIEVSVLTPPTSLPIESEAMLLDYLQTHQCGLVLQHGSKSALLLPQVWEKLPEPQQFLQHLKQKAGWSNDYWHDDICVSRFDVESAQRPFHHRQEEKS
ncbi:AmmeMemoRadiSam system protein A [Vibrio hippocampi]|uniref:AMMECR1 domain-containing protein n=1 Tax=Vibrio hippocampi TaxID=654686 RepID=A0ABN8DN51_9VIBR|nr:AmmeMemoRadiSam system protein A [Vibrio hippocampi]CAH0530428.1 hypothetical protein VHP8226_04062 [Vibrio hippocampi]